ncbi:MAG: tRNA (cytidine(34)-2'-O)-methyltransferase [Flammeovirgaceae bacterium]
MEATGLNLNIVLVEPEIPNNTGNIGRLCVGANCHLHLIEPLGFELSDKRVKRAGLDYWPDLKLTVHKNIDLWLDEVEDVSRMFFFSAKARKPYFDIKFQQGDWLIFGKESVGLGQGLLNYYENQCVTIPFPGKVRSFNLSNAVAMSLGEAMRQLM